METNPSSFISNMTAVDIIIDRVRIQKTSPISLKRTMSRTRSIAKNNMSDSGEAAYMPLLQSLGSKINPCFYNHVQYLDTVCYLESTRGRW